MALKRQLNGEAWLAVLEDISEALGKKGSPVRLCLIGSAACLLGGMEGRTSADLDIWKPASSYDRRELKAAAEKAGLLFDPKQTLDPHRPYLQLVDGVDAIWRFRTCVHGTYRTTASISTTGGKSHRRQTHPLRPKRFKRHSISHKPAPSRL